MKALVLVALGLGLSAAAVHADSATLVLGRSVGAVRIGATKAGVVGVYGQPASLKRLSYGGKPFELAAYAVRGGRLEVFYDRATHRVVGISTSTSFYRTANGLGVGSPAAAAQALGFEWNAECTTTYVKTARGISYELSTRRHSRSGVISNIFFIRSAYAGDC